MAKKIGKKLREFSMETRLKSSNIFKDKILGMFKGYIKSVIVWGSITRGDYTGKSDVDIYIIFDDTKMPLKKFDSIRDRVYDDLLKSAASIDPRLHPQPAIALTEFWDGIRTCHPLFYNIVREGYAIYDTGFFIPMRKLLEWGKFPATAEAAELRFEAVPKRLARVKNVKTYMVAEDLYFSMMDATQAILMYVGVGPPVPKTAVREMKKHLVAEGLLEEKYADLMEKMVSFRKAVEHKEFKGQISGVELDKWIDDAEDYINRMEKLLEDLQNRRKASDIEKSYEVMVKASVAALKAIDKLPKNPKDLPKAFNKHLIEPGLVNPFYGEIFGKVLEMRKMLEDKQLYKIRERDVYMNKEYVRKFVMDVRRVMDKKGPLPEFAKDEKVEKKMASAKAKLDTAKDVDELPDINRTPKVSRKKRVIKVVKKIVKKSKKK
ncbi:MAG: hypothetical protein GOV02_01315 [Candidatus Aenigmarchaeota archaeon]|nr:hypothetical protein [Candidatus Aenigmarchaeota archaeon]